MHLMNHACGPGWRRMPCRCCNHENYWERAQGLGQRVQAVPMPEVGVVAAVVARSRWQSTKWDPPAETTRLVAQAISECVRVMDYVPCHGLLCVVAVSGCVASTLYDRWFWLWLASCCFMVRCVCFGCWVHSSLVQVLEAANCAVHWDGWHKCRASSG